MPDRISSCGPAEVKRGFGVYSHGQMHYRITVPEQPSHMPLMCLHMSPNSSRVYEKSVCPKRGLGRRRPPHGHMARTQNLERRAAIPGRHYVEHFAEHLRGGPRSAWGVQAAFDYKLQEILPLLFQPLLLLNPEDDLHENSRQAASLIRNGRVHELPRCSHSFLDIATEEVAALIRQFLDE